MRKLSYSTHVTYLKGVGEAVAEKLKRLNITTIGELVEDIPRSFEDYSRITPISRVKPGKVTLQANIHNVKSRYSRNGLPIVEALARDGSGQLQLTWFNQPYIQKTIKADTEYYISGEFAKNYRFFAITNPRIEQVSIFPKHTARLVPNYKLTKGITSHALRKLIATALDAVEIPEILPESIVTSEHLMSRSEAVRMLHFPADEQLFLRAKKRLAFEELFVIMLASELNRRDFAIQGSYQQKVNDDALKDFVNTLPFELTNDQRKVTWQMLKLMEQKHPMNCLLQGDVGSGKTVVSLLLAINVIENGGQVAIMAPTELLANQHYVTIQRLIPKNIQDLTVLLTGSVKKSNKEKLYSQIKNGTAKLIIGTHALIQDKVEFKNLHLIIVDEQHRFGVEQRKALQNKANMMPHVLHMSATPIPRSIALTVYGELDIATIKQKPKDRKIISTSVISSDHRKEFYSEKVKNIIDEGNQVFIVAPLIEDSETSSKKKSIESIAREIGSWLPDAIIKVVHGKMPAEQKDQIMSEMKRGEIDALISTTVIEVGIDIPNATLMVIESADSFGLAQLHQLRGRVGRGEKQGYCVLIPTNSESTQRLEVMKTEHSGFTLSEYDLELRGPGAVYGTMQHGALDLRVAKISDTELIEKARNTAREFLDEDKDIADYPIIAKKVEAIRAITNLN